METLLRKLIPKLKLYNFQSLILIYEKYAAIRYRKKFDSVIQFRDSSFVVGKDVTLFPSVYLGTYEQCELDILLNAKFSDYLVFWDIGANIGLYSILFGKKYPNGQIISFEPNEMLHALLQTNFALNDVSNYTVEGVALSSHSGLGEMFANDSRPGAGRIRANSDITSDIHKFRIISGNEYLQLHPEQIPGLIKIDVEGHEPEVIKGISEILSGYKPTLTIEVFKNLWESERGHLWDETLRFLFDVYGEATLITDGTSKVIAMWSSDYLTGGMQTLIFGLDKGNS